MPVTERESIALSVANREMAVAGTALDALRESHASVPAVRAAYVHVPFCFHKCHYCDFYSIVDRDDRQGPFVERLRDEFAAARPILTDPLTSLFVGGGTPTFLAPEHLRATLAIVGSLPRAPDAEWTVEANPETVSEEVAAILVEAGVGRVSLGAQSFDPRHLKTLERWHDPANVARAVARLRGAGIGRISLDLIFGIPGSSCDDWAADLEAALAVGPDHLSCYGLTFEPGTALFKRRSLGLIEECDEELESAMYEHTIDRLADAGFEQYEISNWARRDATGARDERCRHNLTYWRNANWWAFGPSASGHVAGVRWKNVPRLNDWLASSGASPVMDLERPDDDRAAGESLMLGLRLAEGVDLASFAERWGDAFGPERRRALRRHVEDGLLCEEGTVVRLTRRGLRLADAVFADLV